MSVECILAVLALFLMLRVALDLVIAGMREARMEQSHFALDMPDNDMTD